MYISVSYNDKRFEQTIQLDKRINFSFNYEIRITYLALWKNERNQRRKDNQFSARDEKNLNFRFACPFE